MDRFQDMRLPPGPLDLIFTPHVSSEEMLVVRHVSQEHLFYPLCQHNERASLKIQRDASKHVC